MFGIRQTLQLISTILVGTRHTHTHDYTHCSHSCFSRWTWIGQFCY